MGDNLVPHAGGSDVDQAGAEGYRGRNSGCFRSISDSKASRRLDRRYRRRCVSEDKFRLIGENAMLSIFTRSNPQPIREPADVVEILKLAA